MITLKDFRITVEFKNMRPVAIRLSDRGNYSRILIAPEFSDILNPLLRDLRRLERENFIDDTPSIPERTREQHIKWCKRRASEYLEDGDFRNAVTSMISDLTKHPETANHGMNGMALFSIQDFPEAKRFIEGFN